MNANTSNVHDIVTRTDGIMFAKKVRQFNKETIASESIQCHPRVTFLTYKAHIPESA